MVELRVQPGSCGHRGCEMYSPAAAAEMPGAQPSRERLGFIRDTWLSNRIFTCYDNIIDFRCDRWWRCG
jgi:hypothetical protein